MSLDLLKEDMISRGSDTEDFIWAIDHSRRRYLVREARYRDLKHLTEIRPEGLLAIVGLHARMNIIIVPVNLDHEADAWINTDEYAEFRLRSLNILKKSQFDS